MKYQVGHVGKVVAMVLKEGENLYEEIQDVAEKENIQAAAVLITGGCRKADVVVGPKPESLPKIVGKFKDFTGPGEMFGVGTLYPDEDGPKLHLHSGIGKGDEIIIGCTRGGSVVFLTLEVTIIELAGIDAKRVFNEEHGFKLLEI